MPGLWQKLFGPCECCEVLKETLTIERATNRDLLARILPNTNPNTSARPSEMIEPPKQSFIPWRVKRQMLEEQDREKAKLMKQFDKSEPPKFEPITTEELEKEIGIS